MTDTYFTKFSFIFNLIEGKNILVQFSKVTNWINFCSPVEYDSLKAENQSKNP